ncbi:hypothetical protein [Reichenbachiella ulvae]|uniref:DKNYY family protein n=1 Tax=Reichenbachiella ulvae TaxID=2980104 RepID=A0ABT3CN26_9BACT|nr:hypothetical protein [Reichenbachiella ulvae]MCV9385041.1 hypothetical protein [Reichenbachiella ulvae]
MINRVITTALMCIFFPLISYGQISVALLDLEEGIESWYQEVLGQNNTPIANGSYYHIDPQTPRQHQFLASPIWDIGTVYMYGQQFDSIRILYNIYEDLLIVENSGVFRSNYQPIEPNQRAVDEFFIHGQHFVNINSDSIFYGPGFYEEIYKGENLSLYAKHLKTKTVNDMEVQYLKENQYFIDVGGHYEKYVNRRTLYKMFPSHKKEIRSFANRNGVKGKNETSIYNLIVYCEQFVNNYE